ncbi:hypothetical protein CHGG_01597 [Chaetomium globosum CBS 148.51]|uniref:PNPLA domain-containing protein n=1 Tax=Chaetomium globosum (strain ATCC 6205 / CBS 148.51 / DSM 1962 / NBRC 6347 / NRRL 1970) TaxID=306901 RepID=Q2HDV7_CHAGB|nr:uncharacterized protein CHGG_01597 [Chaetomium globosum CBS 148.51]EAQ93362.1 hypothetical protein CHGG_01597 [Chaetomium globosum CBS 148.51]
MLPFLLFSPTLMCSVLQKTVSYLFEPSPLRRWSEALDKAADYDQWVEAAHNLDRILGLDMWRYNLICRDYDYRLINERTRLIQNARQEGDVYGLINTLRTGLVRNLGNITSAKLFNYCFSGTKAPIERYVEQYVEAIQEIALLPPPPADGGPPNVEEVPSEYEDGEIAGDNSIGGNGVESAAPATLRYQSGMATQSLQTQHKLDFITSARQGFGRSALVLQGGAIFGMCHLGVVKALFLRGLLPRIIVGTATGAMIAALVGVHSEEDLLRILTGDGIDLSAFAAHGKNPDAHNEQVMQSIWTWGATFIRRIRRFKEEGYFLDVKVLEDCVRANVGDLTFEEAFNRSKRILNITVVTAGQEGIPTLLNHVTAPNVLVWTAAVASNASSDALYGRRQTRILCKDAHGNIGPWAPADTADFRHWTLASYTDRNAPLQRVSGLFNVNHYIVSQARPYLVPFLQSDMHGPAPRLFGGGFGVAGLRSLVMRMHLPGPSVTLVPRLAARDFARLMETPTRDTLEYWILRGERSVWPAVAALRVRCAIEMELDRAYQDVRRLKAGGLRRKGSEVAAMARDRAQAQAQAQGQAPVQGQAQTQVRARVGGGGGGRG